MKKAEVDWGEAYSIASAVMRFSTCDYMLRGIETERLNAEGEH